MKCSGNTLELHLLDIDMDQSMCMCTHVGARVCVIVHVCILTSQSESWLLSHLVLAWVPCEAPELGLVPR